MEFYVKVTFIFGILIAGCQCKDQDPDCTLERDGKNGTCVPLKECPGAIKALKETGLKPEICGGFQSTDPIVCCLNLEPSSTPKPEEPSTNAEDKNTVGYRSKQKCIEYGKSVFTTVAVLPLVPGSEGVKINVSRCAEQSNSFLPGWNDAVWIKKFPHVASIGYEDESSNIQWACTGSLISEQYVLTAAHCSKSRSMGAPKYVRLGIVDSSKKDEMVHAQNFTVLEAIVHPDFNFRATYHDVALLKLDKKANIGEYVRPACLGPRNDLKEKDKAILVAWEQSQRSTEECQMVQSVERLVTEETCNVSYSKLSSTRRLRNGIDYSTQMCTAGDDKICQFLDDGAPLQTYNQDVYCMYDVVGIKSFGVKCGSNLPTVYTRVSRYLEWIENIVWP